jgi:hypothetical protein
MNARTARWLAIAIAVLAAVDPSFTSARRAQAVVAVLASGPNDSAQARAAATSLGDAFTVVRSPYAAAAATVIVGDQLPDDVAHSGGRLFAIARDTGARGVRVQHVATPARVPLASRARVDAAVRATGAAGARIVVALRANGVVLDRVTHDVTTGDTLLHSRLSYVPTADGVSTLHVTASIEETPSSHSAAVAVDVRDHRWSVLFFDRRPSWMSTFVRRAVERDRRFAVTSRVVTSRGVSTDRGRPPAALDQLVPLELFDAIVVGAPEALIEGDIAGLENVLRRRGAGVVMLLDQQTPGPYERLVGVRAWRSMEGRGAVQIDERQVLQASELAWPADLPGVSEPLAMADANAVIWRSSVGGGSLVVSGAFDAWRYRDSASSDFEAFWRDVVAGAAAGSAPAIEARIARSVVAPGERAELEVIVRDRAPGRAGPPGLEGPPAEGASDVSARLETSGGPVLIDLWHVGAGRFRGAFHAPDVPGVHRIAVSANGAREDVGFVVDSAPAYAAPDEGDLVAASAAARGGRVVDADALADVLASELPAVTREVVWYPMRSAWWIVPFALLLGINWGRGRKGEGEMRNERGGGNEK